MIVSARNHAKGDVFLLKTHLKGGECIADRRTRILIEPRQNVRGAGNDFHTLVPERTRHHERGAIVGRAVIKAGQKMTMQINHRKG